MSSMNALVRIVLLLAILTPFLFGLLPTATAARTYSLSPQDPGPCAIATTTVILDGEEIDFYFPQDGSCEDGTNAPYPSVIFAHGYSMSGLSDGPADNQGNGEHLASWGYVVGIPALPDDFEDRVNVIIHGLDYLQAATIDQASFLYGKVDNDRLATAGYSLGGATALAVAARDARVRTVITLDPVYHEGGFSGEEGDPVWDPASEAPNIEIPAGVLGAPADICNANADYQDLYILIGSDLKASYEIVDASHCVFPDPGNAYCGFSCGGLIEEYMTELSQKYMTSWLNYHLKGSFAFYSYLYGVKAEEDIKANLIVRQVETFPSLIFIPLLMH